MYSHRHYLRIQQIGQFETRGPKKLQLESFEEALHDQPTQLTYTSLSDVQKQSVEDVEQLFSEPLIAWMKIRNYLVEETYLSSVHGWRHACDKREMSHAQRTQLNTTFHNYVLDELMPWHKTEEMRDFSLLEVNRYSIYNVHGIQLNHCKLNVQYSCRSISGILGFSRETLIAIISNIESREWRMTFNTNNGIQLEHPRSRTTNDIESFLVFYETQLARVSH